EVRIDDLFLVAEPFECFRLAEPFDHPAADDLPVGLTGPTGTGQRLRVLAVLGNANLVGMLAEADVGRPLAQLHAACDVEDRHRSVRAPSPDHPSIFWE